MFSPFLLASFLRLWLDIIVLSTYGRVWYDHKIEFNYHTAMIATIKYIREEHHLGGCQGCMIVNFNMHLLCSNKTVIILLELSGFVYATLIEQSTITGSGGIISLLFMHAS